MSLPIYWTPTAKDNYANLLNIIKEKEGQDVALLFLDKTEEIIGNIALAPRGFPSFEQDTRFRIAIITPQTSIIFQVTRVNGRLLYFWDNRNGVSEK